MIAMQYKITLPSDYDMRIIRDRVQNNGYKTDGFEDLKSKLYLITEIGINKCLQNSYSPLYLWKNTNGLNKFLFNGYYDNILKSFGWQHVNVGIPLIDTTTDKIKESKYVFEISRTIQAQESLNNLTDKILNEIPMLDHTEYAIIYNPDKWEYSVFYFNEDVNKFSELNGVMYTVLHVST